MVRWMGVGVLTRLKVVLRILNEHRNSSNNQARIKIKSVAIETRSSLSLT
jgi:hypothetical protein